MGSGGHLDRLNSAADAARTQLMNRTADRWEIFAKASLTREVEVTPDHPLKIITVEQTGVAVRTFNDGKSGFAAASGLEGEAARRAADSALTNTSDLSADPIPPHRLLGLGATTPPRTLPAAGWATHVAQELGRAVASLGGGKLRLRRAIVQEGEFAWVQSTAEGWAARHEDASTSVLTEVEGVEDRGGIWRDWLHIPNSEAFDPDAAAALISDRAMLTRCRMTTDGGLRDLILHPEVAAQLLAAIAPLFLATAEDDDRLPPLLDRHGRLAARALSLFDDRSDPHAPITGPCDGEGLPARRTLLLDEGVPRYRLASYRDAVRCAETPRGGAVRVSYRDYPRTGLANLAVDTSGGVRAGELLGTAEHALYLLRPLATIRLDTATDSYRIIASGVWLDGQKVRGWHPVVELRGSLGRLLRRIDAVGTDLRWFQTNQGFIGTPSLLIRRQPVVR